VFVKLFFKEVFSWKAYKLNQCLGTLILLGFILLLDSFQARSQSDTTQQTEFFQASMDKLLQRQIDQKEEEVVKITTQTTTSVRETPGIVTIITREDIDASGALDLIDLLRTVPGIEFGIDVQNVVGIGVRGNWGFEGKVLIALDGQMLNETNYGCYNFAGRVILDNIEKIEIIRGPGSVIYGGVAGLAVINMITKSGKKGDVVSLSQQVGISDGVSRTASQLNVSKEFLNGLAFNVAAGLSEGNISNKTLTGFNGETINYKDSSSVKTYFVNASAQFKNLDVRLLFEEHSSKIIESPGRVIFGSHHLSAKYSILLGKKVTVIPTVFITRQLPWYLEDVPDYSDNTLNYRYTGNLQLVYEATPNLTVITGIEGFTDHAKMIPDTSTYRYYNNKSNISFSNKAFFAQSILKTRIANINLGLRVDDHSSFGVAFAPRIGLTKIVKDWHFKLLYSTAFKAPTIQNIEANQKIEPETINTSEIEIGYQITPSVLVKANIFDVVIKNVILYDPVDIFTDHYSNGGSSGTRGCEVAFESKFKWGFINANYSFYTNSKNDVDAYNVESHRKYKLGFPTNKGSLQAGYKINHFLTFHSSILITGKRYASVLYEENYKLMSIPGAAKANIFFRYRDFLFNGLDMTFGIYNLLGRNYQIVQPYLGEDNALPSQGREFSMKLQLGLK
jgi:outer membrane cobalamin receptor